MTSVADRNPIRKPTVSLIIPAYNEEREIGDCLDSVVKQGPDAFSQIIVVDNASTDRTGDMARAYPGVIVLNETHRGPTRARERGREVATGELIAYIDADTRLPVGWVDKAQRIFVERPDIVSLSGPARYFDATPFEQRLLSVLWWASILFVTFGTGYAIYGANMLVRKSVMDAVGGFNRDIDFYGDETELAGRLKRKGKVLFRSDFYTYGSMRRFKQEGILYTSFIYAINFIWTSAFNHPFTKTHTNIRAETP